MNKIILIGRLTRDPEVFYSRGEKAMPVARYSLAVDRKRKRDDGGKADFFRIVAFDRVAEFAEKYLRKGIKIAVVGHVQTGSYEKDGVTLPTFEIVAETQEFVESRGLSQGDSNPDGSYTAEQDGFMNVPEDAEGLPFN